ncbi:hypothetical protein DER45DRAFT_208990 [Fusarium avenaceum]|nr:hypothetical protein DER45DRAFT_208990 [Fusarium avenaceum]
MGAATVSAASYDVETIRAPTFRPGPWHILMQGPCLGTLLLCLCFSILSYSLIHSFKNLAFTTTIAGQVCRFFPTQTTITNIIFNVRYAKNSTPIHTTPRSQSHTMAHHSRLETMSSRFSPSRLRDSLRRSSSASTSTQASFSSVNTTSSSTAVAINNIISRQPSLLSLEAERRSFGSELSLLEPRPIVYWGSVEERMR